MRSEQLSHQEFLVWETNSSHYFFKLGFFLGLDFFFYHTKKIYIFSWNKDFFYFFEIHFLLCVGQIYNPLEI